MKQLRPLWLLIALMTSWAWAKPMVLTSPNDALVVSIEMGETIHYTVIHRGTILVKENPIAMTIESDVVLGRKPHLKGSHLRSRVTETVESLVPTKFAQIETEYSEAELTFTEGFKLVFRVYDDAVAYRFITELAGPMKVISEQVQFNFIADHHIYFPEEESYLTHQERIFKYMKLSEITPQRFSSLPALVDIEGGPKVAIAEADLRDYPGMYLEGTSGTTLKTRFPGVALEEHQDRDRTVRVTKAADYLADTQGARKFPWRVMIVAEKDTDLLENNTIFLLAEENQLEDTSWIKPGKIAWDWWNACNIWGVDFRAGVNTETYKHYIDFASEHGIEYIILDEGWYVLGDLLNISEGMDMEELFAYAKQKNVGIIPWVVWKTLDDQLEPALDQFEKWGAVGLKIDFMQRDDQWMVNYYERILKAAAERKLMVDYHGCYTPRGLRRTYPNLMTREGVKGLENCKWSADVTPEHDVTLPFTRMLTGPMDFTPGAMHNAQERNFIDRFTRPMSQGTRCHQLAMYVLYESPWQMLADSPSMYEKEEECMEFLGAVPAVWDETHALDAQVGDYLLVARRSGDEWYVGAMTDWSPRHLTVDCSFLPEGSFTAQIYQDGLNADQCAEDYKMIRESVSSETSLNIKLAPGGGWVARITPN